MLITCPYCGPRDLAEFFVGGEAETRPDVAGAPDDAANVAAFAEAVYLRDNPAGPHRERWFHAAGCQSWLTLERDTTTHEVHAVELARPGEISA
ncbi:sarcosine oxidase subunit delta [Methylocella sp.]|uniref:sarcosine oxidase subunit delta n=1 Tax=Methylocella sp. TaxID=1978226 RepID=UPI003783381F